MELFFKNVPPNLTDDTLEDELRPFMEGLKIHDWTCDKPRHKTFAWVSFLSTSDGLSFLAKYGKLSEPSLHPDEASGIGYGLVSSAKHGKAPELGHHRPSALPQKHHAKDIARLYITKSPVFVQKSNRQVGKETLRHLKHKKQEGTNRPPDRSMSLPAFTILLRSISCGFNLFGDDGRLTFAPQTSLATFATARFTRRTIIVAASDVFRFDILTESVQDLIVSHSSHTATLVLTEPPRFYLPCGEGSWLRQLACPGWPKHEKFAGCCLVYRLALSNPGDFKSFLTSLKHRDVLSVTNDDISIMPSPDRHIKDYQTSLTKFEGKLQSIGNQNKHLSFTTLFQIEAFVWNNYLHPAEGCRIADLMAKLSRRALEAARPVPFTVESIKKLFQEIPYPCPDTEPEVLDAERLVNRILQIEANFRMDNPLRDPVYGTVIADSQAWVMKAMITPTRIVLHGPEPESKNRILRKFSKHTDYFIRCLFCEDDGQDLSFNPKVSNDAVYDRFRQVFSKGIRIAGRHFSFLGFSHSSLRSHSAWFMAPFVDENYQKQSYDTIIRGLGSFEDIKVPAKCAARIGQAFSETLYAVQIFDVGIQTQFIPDVTSKDDSRVFSDGVGTISYEAAEELWAHLPARSKAATCFQIRWSGAKGMLSLDSTLQGKIFCIRKGSMMKFVSRDVMELGICDTASKPLRLWLNRQMIKILEDMGTRHEWFMALQTKELRFLRAITAQAINTSTFLKYQLIGTSMGLPNLIKILDRLDIDFRRDTFLKSVVEHVVLRELRLLKHKARIPVDQGVTLFGIMDETGYLKEGEIYVTFDNSHDRIGRPPREGPVLVTRSPALHPGDIKSVKMVTPPKESPLRHLRNCIVFSQHGERDLPSQLSGGDLDGDLYSVIWDPKAVPKREFSAADYPRVTPPPLDRPVTRDDIADFFINFMKTDVLGVIAIRHQILADAKDDGTLDPGCIELAELHSTAVDSSKTGIPVNIKDLPKAPKERPDFLAPAPPAVLYDLGQIAHIGQDEGDNDKDEMSSTKHRYYRSEKILGELYRSIDEDKIWHEDIHRDPEGENRREGESLWAQLLDVTPIKGLVRHGTPSCDYRRRLPEAWKIRKLYESAIEDMMWQFSDNPRKCITEVEVFCGSIFNKRGSQTRRQRDSSIKLREEIDRVMDWIVKLMRESNALEGEDGEDEGSIEHGDMAALELCLACLVVGCVKEPKQEVAYQGNSQLNSFKLVAAGCVVKELTDHVLLSPTYSEAGGYVGVTGGRAEVTLAIR